MRPLHVHLERYEARKGVVIESTSFDGAFADFPRALSALPTLLSVLANG